MRADRDRHEFGGGQAVDRKTHLAVELQGGGLGVERGKTFRRSARALEGQGFSALRMEQASRRCSICALSAPLAKISVMTVSCAEGATPTQKSPFLSPRREGGQDEKQSGRAEERHGQDFTGTRDSSVEGRRELRSGR